MLSVFHRERRPQGGKTGCLSPFLRRERRAHRIRPSLSSVVGGWLSPALVSQLNARDSRGIRKGRLEFTKRKTRPPLAPSPLEEKYLKNQRTKNIKDNENDKERRGPSPAFACMEIHLGKLGSIGQFAIQLTSAIHTTEPIPPPIHRLPFRAFQESRSMELSTVHAFLPVKGAA